MRASQDAPQLKLSKNILTCKFASHNSELELPHKVEFLGGNDQVTSRSGGAGQRSQNRCGASLGLQKYLDMQIRFTQQRTVWQTFRGRCLVTFILKLLCGGTQSVRKNYLGLPLFALYLKVQPCHRAASVSMGMPRRWAIERAKVLQIRLRFKVPTGRAWPDPGICGYKRCRDSHGPNQLPHTYMGAQQPGPPPTTNLVRPVGPVCPWYVRVCGHGGATHCWPLSCGALPVLSKGYQMDKRKRRCLAT